MIGFVILSLIPLVGTSLGAILGIFNNKFDKQEEILVAVATGILGAICFSLLIEASDYIQYKELFIGMLVGFLFIVLMNFFAKRCNFNVKSKLFWAMLIHNIPEGIVIGIALAGKETFQIFSIIFSVTLQNVPDGLVVSMPIVSTYGKKRALFLGVLSGVVEPIASLFIVISATHAVNLQILEPFLIGFSLSAIVMITFELIKECNRYLLMVATAFITIIFNSILG